MNYKCVTKVMFNTSFDLENISFPIFPCSHFFTMRYIPKHVNFRLNYCLPGPVTKKLKIINDIDDLIMIGSLL